MSRIPHIDQVEILLQTIVEAQSIFVNNEDCHSGFDHVLQSLLKLTDSRYGFIGEVLTNDEAKPFLKTHAISNIAWNEETRKLYNQFAPNLEFTNLDNLFGKVIISGEPVIANSPGGDSRRGGLPKGHPPLNAFLGVPFYHGNKLVGMAGIANRPGGYSEELVAFLQPLLTFCGTVIEATRNEQYRRQAERALRESEERLSLVLDATSSGVWDWNVQTGHVYYSKQFVESLGYKPEEVPPRVEFWENLVHPQDWPKVMATLSEHLEGKTEIYECENRLRMASGDWRWDLDRGRVIEWDAEGKPLRMVGADIDISNRKRLEEKNLTLQYALDHGREGFALLDEQGRYTYVNPSHAEQYGYEATELMGQSWECLYSHDQIAHVYDVCFPALDSQGWWQGELVGSKKNGKIFDVEIFLTLLKDEKGQQQGILCTCRDITERKRAESDLRESESRFRNLADTAPVLIWMSDTEKLCTYVNKGWLDFTGRTMEQERGHGWIDGIHPEDQQWVLAMCEAAFKSHKPFEMEFRIKHVSGHYRWVIDRGVPRFSPDGTFLGYIGSCSDISEQKDHEQAVRQYNEVLQEEVEQRAARIQELEQRRMQVEKLAALSQVAAGVAHEINNPLASIRQSFELVKRMLSPDHPRFSFVEKIDQEINRIAHITKQMYQLYQPRHAYPRLTNLGEAATDAVELMKTLHKNLPVRLRMDVDKDVLDLPLPSTELHQVLCNVLRNAFEAVEPEGSILVSTGKEKGKVWIKVKDDGAGIRPDVLPHIFDPFYSTKDNREGSGMGLGLSVSRSLVEAMGGSLEVESSPGSGTTFTIAFALPLIPTFPNNEGESSTCPAQVIS